MEEGFVGGQSDNLPRIDIFTVMEYFSSNPSLVCAEINRVKLFEAGRASYRDEAIGYVQVKREGTKCTVKCRVSLEDEVRSAPYRCTLVCDENEKKVETVVCHDCSINQGVCNHMIAFLIWLYKKSEEPETTSVKHYWTGSPSFSNIKFIKAKDFKNEISSQDEDSSEDEYSSGTNNFFKDKLIENETSSEGEVSSASNIKMNVEAIKKEISSGDEDSSVSKSKLRKVEDIKIEISPDDEDSSVPNIEFIKVEQIKNVTTSEDEDSSVSKTKKKEDTNLLMQFVEECKKRNITNCLIMKYFTEPSIEMKASLHHLICDYEGENGQFSVDDFIEFCKQNITEAQCDLIEKATRDQSDNSLRFELRYGRITASIAHKASKCKTPGDDFIEEILGAYAYKKEPIDIQKGILLKDKVRAQVENNKKIKIQKCGLFLSKEHPTFCASPYGLTEEHVIEVKYPLKNKNMTKYVNNEKLAPKYEARVQLQMYFAKKQKALFCIARKDFKTSKQVDVYEIIYDPYYCKKIIDECTLFWKHVFDSMIKIKQA